MYPPKGFDYKNKICKLFKAMYGLKQASLSWNKRFTNFLKQNNLEQLKTNQCIFKHEKSNLLLTIYVDDGIIKDKNKKEINKLIINLK